MFAKGYNNMRALIETQYVIISQMINDIVNHYEDNLQDINTIAERTAVDNSEGDKDVYFSILNSYNDYEINASSLVYESRKILFCSIFSYYETMLNNLLRYYDISCKSTQVKAIFDTISEFYKERYGEPLDYDEGALKYINDLYRLLRNLFMHGPLSKDIDRKNLVMEASRNEYLRVYDESTIFIENKDFLYKALEDSKKILVSIDVSFNNKIIEVQKTIEKAKDLVAEAIRIYPPKYPGSEDTYPPHCSLKVHHLLLEAEKLYKPIAEKGNTEAQMFLADLYLSAFETPNKEKGLEWLKKSANQGYEPAIKMLKEFLD